MYFNVTTLDPSQADVITDPLLESPSSPHRSSANDVTPPAVTAVTAGAVTAVTAGDVTAGDKTAGAVTAPEASSSAASIDGTILSANNLVIEFPAVVPAPPATGPPLATPAIINPTTPSLPTAPPIASQKDPPAPTSSSSGPKLTFSSVLALANQIIAGEPKTQPLQPTQPNPSISIVNALAKGAPSPSAATPDNLIEPLGPLKNLIPEYLWVPAHVFPRVVLRSQVYVLPFQEQGITVPVAMVTLDAMHDKVITRVVGISRKKDLTFPPGIMLNSGNRVVFGHSGGVLNTVDIPMDVRGDSNSVSDLTSEAQVGSDQAAALSNAAAAGGTPNISVVSSDGVSSSATSAPSVSRSGVSTILTKGSVPDNEVPLNDQNITFLLNFLKGQSTEQVAMVPIQPQYKPEPAKPKRRAVTKRVSQDKPKYTSVRTDLIGTIINMPETTSNPGLISYEISDGFATTPFYSDQVLCPIEGAVTVQFDLSINSQRMKCEAVRVRNAPPGAKLKNDSVKKKVELGHKKPIKRSGLPCKFQKVNDAPTSVYTKLKICKQGLIGELTKLPCGDVAGQVTYIVGTEKLVARTEQAPPGARLKSLVKFDLGIWYNSTCHPEATNLTLHEGPQAIYKKDTFIFKGGKTKRSWSVEEFRKLLIALREDDKQFNWPKVALKTGRSISEINHLVNAVTEQISGKQTKGGQMQSFVELLAVEAQNQVVMLNPQPEPSTPRESTKKLKSRKKEQFFDVIVDSLQSVTGHDFIEHPQLNVRQSFVAKNLAGWSSVEEVTGDRKVNGVLSDVMAMCSAGAGVREGIDYCKIYQYIGTLVAEQRESVQRSSLLETLSREESVVILYLMQNLFSDIAKRNLHTHKQFLLQRYFDVNGKKIGRRTPINPFRLKPFLLHLPAAT